MEQKENDNNDSLFKIHGGLYIASSLIMLLFSFCSIKATKKRKRKFAKRVFVFIIVLKLILRYFSFIFHLIVFKFGWWIVLDIPYIGYQYSCTRISVKCVLCLNSLHI